MFAWYGSPQRRGEGEGGGTSLDPCQHHHPPHTRMPVVPHRFPHIFHFLPISTHSLPPTPSARGASRRRVGGGGPEDPPEAGRPPAGRPRGREQVCGGGVCVREPQLMGSCNTRNSKVCGPGVTFHEHSLFRGPSGPPSSPTGPGGPIFLNELSNRSCRIFPVHFFFGSWQGFVFNRSCSVFPPCVCPLGSLHVSLPDRKGLVTTSPWKYTYNLHSIIHNL